MPKRTHVCQIENHEEKFEIHEVKLKSVRAQQNIFNCRRALFNALHCLVYLKGQNEELGNETKRWETAC